MRYHIDTIPVWDAMKLGCECPMCALRAQVEATDVDRCLGGSVMEPDARIEVNRKGFCGRHHALLYAQQNRLGHALMTHTHLKETDEKAVGILENAEKNLRREKGLKAIKAKGENRSVLTVAAEELEKLISTCIICDSIRENMGRYAYTFLHLYASDSSFRKAFEGSKGLCYRDAALLLRMAGECLSAEQQADFAAVLLRLTTENSRRVEDELEWFTLKFDYRNADKPWNNSRDALERAAERLRGRCIGETKK